jgi:aldose 1-epimerase
VTSPSGEQIELERGSQRVVVVEVGAGIRSYTLDGKSVLDGYGADDLITSGRGQVLIPWPNRLQDGSYEFDGTRYQLALTEPEHGNAIHGLIRWAGWTVGARDSHRVVMKHALHPQPGYPFSLALEIEYELTQAGLAVRTTATNVGSARCPYGAGAHPYLTLGTPTVDPLSLHVPGRTLLKPDERGLPIGTNDVAGTEYDFRSPRSIGETKLDHCFTDLGRDEDGLARVRLVDPRDVRGIELWVDARYRYLMLFTGDTRADVARRSIAVEPMTCPPNAFRTGDDLIVIDPGETVTSTWGISPS